MAAAVATAAGRYALKQNSAINVTPFVDVMLVLLIVMMVATPMATVAIQMDLPPAPKEAPPSRPPTYVSIGDDGRIYVSFGAAGMRATDLNRLGEDLAASLATADPLKERVLLRADRHVRYGKFMQVLDRLHRDGYTHVGLINENLD
jgi:biopolymer transport protein ExbD